MGAIGRVIKESPWKRTRIYLISDNEAAIVIEGRSEGNQSWDQIQGFILSRDMASAVRDLFLELPV